MVNVDNFVYCLFGDGIIHVFHIKTHGEWNVLPSLPRNELPWLDDTIFVVAGDIFLHRRNSRWRLDELNPKWILHCVKEQIWFVNASE